MGQIKTSEEVLAELQAKKIKEAEAIIQATENTRLFLEAYKPSFEVKHTLGSIKEVKSLKSVLKCVLEGIQELSIPTEIKITEKKEINYTFSNRSKRFLVVFSIIAFVLATFGTVIGVLGYQAGESSPNELILAQKNWLINYQNQMHEKCPESSSKIMQKLGDFPD